MLAAGSPSKPSRVALYSAGPICFYSWRGRCRPTHSSQLLAGKEDREGISHYDDLQGLEGQEDWGNAPRHQASQGGCLGAVLHCICKPFLHPLLPEASAGLSLCNLHLTVLAPSASDQGLEN